MTYTNALGALGCEINLANPHKEHVDNFLSVNFNNKTLRLIRCKKTGYETSFKLTKKRALEMLINEVVASINAPVGPEIPLIASQASARARAIMQATQINEINSYVVSLNSKKGG